MISMGRFEDDSRLSIVLLGGVYDRCTKACLKSGIQTATDGGDAVRNA
jgi:hypothetical protein